MSPQVAERVQDAFAGSRRANRIGLSDFSHGRKWREDLADASILEIVDRTETAGWLLSDDGLGSLVGRIQELEDELEQARLAAIFASRADRDSWARGDELAEAAKASARARRKAIEEAADAGER